MKTKAKCKRQKAKPELRTQLIAGVLCLPMYVALLLFVRELLTMEGG